MCFKIGFLKSYFARWLVELRNIARDTIKQAFPRYPFKISGYTVDSLTKKVLFIIKAQGVSAPIKLTAEEIITDEQYLIGLANQEKQKIKQQYLKDILRPKAYITEYPISDDEEDTFKIALIEKNKIVCLTAKKLFEEKKNIFLMLSKEDVIRVTIRYCEQKYLKDLQSEKSSLCLITYN